MIAELKPYQEYKESGLPWLGKVPAHWSVSRIKTVLRETDRRSADGSGTLLSLTRVHGLIPHRDMTDKMHSARSLIGYKRYRAGQLVMNRMQAWSGMFGAGLTDGLVSPDYAVFDVLGEHATKLVLERLKVPDLVSQFAVESKGIGSGFNRLYTDRFGPIPISLPPPAEQAAIVRFLEWANGRLERAIRAKRKVIALLNEQKQAIIHRAVTRGLDPSVPLKPSGIEWLGDIPQHWEIRKLRHLTRQIIDGTHFTPDYRADGIAFLRVTDIHGKEIDQSKLRRISKDEHLKLNKRCNPAKGDLLLSKNGTIGITKVVDWDFPFSIFVSLCLIKPIKSLVDPRFISFAFAGGLLEQQLADTTKTTSVTNLHLDKIRTLILPLPPLAEQADIFGKTHEELDPIETTISRLEREIDLLREYRTRLVADVVTGKLDVREAAARLPDEAPADSIEDDSDLSDEPDAADEEAAE